MQERISDAEFFDHLTKNGVPQKFQDKRLTLKDYGKNGVWLNDVVWDYDKWTELTAKTKFLNLHSTSQKGAECVALAIRSCLLLCRSTGFVSLRKLLSREEFETVLFENRFIIGIPRFEYASGIDLQQNIELGSKMLQFEELVYDHFDNGGIMIVGSGNPIKQFQGYRKNFIAHLSAVGMDINIDE